MDRSLDEIIAERPVRSTAHVDNMHLTLESHANTSQQNKPRGRRPQGPPRRRDGVRKVRSTLDLRTQLTAQVPSLLLPFEHRVRDQESVSSSIRMRGANPLQQP